eukprot:scaffold28378_cov223-Skeletonema_marinoi.AAC.18
MEVLTLISKQALQAEWAWWWRRVYVRRASCRCRLARERFILMILSCYCRVERSPRCRRQWCNSHSDATNISACYCLDCSS